MVSRLCSPVPWRVSPVWLGICTLLLLGGVTAAMSSPSPHAYIRVVQDEGIWWFEDGSGRRFFSLGVNCIGGCFGHAEATPLTPSRQRWIEASLQDWGFNTTGAWSSPSLWDARYVADQIYPEFSEAQDDVFDESLWNDWLAAQLQREVQTFLGKKNFLGYFLDNEREWKAQDIFELYMRLPKGTPGSRAFITFVEQYYQGDLNTLNAEWRTLYASFDQIAGTRPPTAYPRAMQWGILRAWRTEVARTYYRRYAESVRALDPHHLILGVRYRGVPDRDLFVALSPYFDVNSINDYNRYGHLRSVYEELYQATGKPLMITEFSFSGFPRPGSTSGLFIDVYRQDHRGLGYRKYVQQAARAPFMVGMHWFMWMDYPTHDRAQEYPYPPDQNVGLVSHDETVVYAALAQAVKQMNAEVEVTHRDARGIRPSEPVPAHRVLRPFVPLIDGDLAEWPQELVVKPTTVNALVDPIHTDHRYFFSWDEHGLYLAAEITAPSQQPPPPDRPWQGDYLALHLRPVTPLHPGPAAGTTILLYPIGGGADRQQPLAVRKDGPRRYHALALHAVKRLRPGAYTLEARIPTEAVADFSEMSGSTWHLELWYQNVEEIYQTSWEGIVTLEP
jgi:hypothetical protein